MDGQKDRKADNPETDVSLTDRKTRPMLSKLALEQEKIGCLCRGDGLTAGQEPE